MSASTNKITLRAAALWAVVVGLSVGSPPAMAADPPAGHHGGAFDAVESVSSSRVLIWYHTAPGSPAAEQIDLWYTSDRGHTWRKEDARQAATLPVAFDAESDGLYGLYLVLHNATGASAPPPVVGTAPQKWVHVDRSAPLVQVLGLRPDEHFAVNREIHIRWVARDDNLPNRPVKLYYRCEQTKVYQLVADLLAAESSHRWTVPMLASGRIEVKVTASDLAGNTGRCVVDRLRIEDSRAYVSDVPGARKRQDASAMSPSRPGDETAAGDLRHGSGVAPEPLPDGSLANGSGNVPHRGFTEPPPAVEHVSRGAARHAKKLYDLGTWHRLRGELAQAEERYRDALDFDPALQDAQNDLAGLLFLQGDLAGAEKAYDRIIEADPRCCAALKGLALLQATRRNYRSSRETLQRLILLRPQDAEAWLHLGDATMFTGDRRGAREAWKEVGVIEGAPEDVKRRASQRLAIYQNDRMTTGGGDGP